MRIGAHLETSFVRYFTKKKNTWRRAEGEKSGSCLLDLLLGHIYF